MKPIRPLIEIDDARALIRQHFSERPVKKERVPLFEALGRYLAMDLNADQDMPPFDKSTVDGYAVNTSMLHRKLTSGENLSNGCPSLRLVGEVVMGTEVAIEEVDLEDSCIYIPTGGFLPKGFDAVVKLEEIEQKDGRICFENLMNQSGDKSMPVFQLQPGTNVIRKGEDVQAGDKIIKRGRRLTRYDLGVLGMLGFKEVEVIVPPSLSIATTGDELVDIDAPLSPGKIRDINGTVLAGIAREWGLGPVKLTRLEDTYEAVESYVKSEIDQCDILITSGGSSVGKKDYIPAVVQSLSDHGLLFHGMNIKPGKPIGVAAMKGKPVVLLPGNPVSTVVGFIVLVSELVNQFGFDIQHPFCYAELMETIGAEDGRTTYHMVRLTEGEEKMEAAPLRGKSGLITYIANADGYVVVPLETGEVKAGSRVKVFLL
ncbi:molybdopterin molybdotransferase MoeA [Acidaminobacter hydrogenoformans]|uniref:Molybdopterin molybdenumtransferase n=1 Tax=Acidaminobacter hydrogenoformans DSM 2784 TaxID=1120920 RepID=A0A1G5S1B3_9FIRM|nr:molybdopterin molybdotransferase MoeA [Acidaminobacter hydrogenoformans]SCZ79938.1 molybdopterin molybdochelatase [Acidaminobacter hydrogenoformans DSM 2784]